MVGKESKTVAGLPPIAVNMVAEEVLAPEVLAIRLLNASNASEDASLVAHLILQAHPNPEASSSAVMPGDVVVDLAVDCQNSNASWFSPLFHSGEEILGDVSYLGQEMAKECCNAAHALYAIIDANHAQKNLDSGMRKEIIGAGKNTPLSSFHPEAKLFPAFNASATALASPSGCSGQFPAALDGPLGPSSQVQSDNINDHHYSAVTRYEHAHSGLVREDKKNYTWSFSKDTQVARSENTPISLLDPLFLSTISVGETHRYPEYFSLQPVDIFVLSPPRCENLQRTPDYWVIDIPMEECTSLGIDGPFFLGSCEDEVSPEGHFGAEKNVSPFTVSPHPLCLLPLGGGGPGWSA